MSAKASVDFNERRARFRHYENAEAIVAYQQRLDREWPERTHLIEHIAELVMALDQPQPHLLELCCGPGRLAESLLTTVPNMHYTGVDISPPFLDFARQRLAAYRDQVQLWEVDLTDATWPEQLVAADSNGRFHAIVSLQSLHDVGDEAAVSRVYGLARQLLVPGGFLLNADLVVPEGEELPNNPGRRSIERHLALLQQQGYHAVTCTQAVGGFGCVVGQR
jgi:SAM-dependent methyltransferase